MPLRYATQPSKIREGGEDWISEEMAERKFGFPRELLAMMSNREPLFPRSHADRMLRRRVILCYYLKITGLQFVSKDLSRLLRIAESDSKKIESGPGGLSPKLVERCQVLLLYAIAQVEKKGLALRDSLRKDFGIGQPSAIEVRDEYKRYLGAE